MRFHFYAPLLALFGGAPAAKFRREHAKRTRPFSGRGLFFCVALEVVAQSGMKRLAITAAAVIQIGRDKARHAAVVRAYI
jgi:hypothetical protein